jgi:hypothetical protein
MVGSIYWCLYSIDNSASSTSSSTSFSPGLYCGGGDHVQGRHGPQQLSSRLPHFLYVVETPKQKHANIPYSALMERCTGVLLYAQTSTSSSRQVLTYFFCWVVYYCWHGTIRLDQLWSYFMSHLIRLCLVYNPWTERTAPSVARGVVYWVLMAPCRPRVLLTLRPAHCTLPFSFACTFSSFPFLTYSSLCFS